MTMPTIQQPDDDALQRFRVKLADGNAVEAVHEIGERVVRQAVQEHELYDAGLSSRVAAVGLGVRRKKRCGRMWASLAALGF